MILELIRDDEPSQKHNWGKFFVDRLFFGETLEDTDRYLETGGEKIHGDTAIPRGTYEIRLSMSNRFKRVMPEVLKVPGFTGVRIHGGNTEHDTLGCPLLGTSRNANSVFNCLGPNSQLIRLLEHTEANGEMSWLTVR